MKNMTSGVHSDLHTITHIVIDVDGTLTDGGIYYDEHGNEFKKFCTRDGAGFFAAHESGLSLIVLTGRESFAVRRRMAELRVDIIEQNITNKGAWLAAFMDKNKIVHETIAFIGDELNDIAGMRLCGFVACPVDACAEVKAIANYISPLKGGDGVVRDVIEYMLKVRGQWDVAVREVYHFV